MRIIYFSHTFFSDCDFPLIRELERMGHDVYTFYHLSKWELNAGLVEIKKQPMEDKIIKASYIREMEVYKDFVNLDHVYFVNNPHYRRFHYQKRLVWLKMFLIMKSIKADVVQITYQLSGWERMLYLLRRPIVMTVHDPFLHSGRFEERAEKARISTFKHSDKLILLNNDMKSDFEKYYKIPKGVIHTSKLGEYSHIRIMKADNPNIVEKPFILFFGYIAAYKGLSYLLKAMEQVHKNNPKVSLLIIGSGKIDFDYSPYEGKDYIRFENRFASVSELSFLLQHCLFAVCPYTDATQSGVVQTAFSAGCPLVVSNVGNLPKAVTNNVNGMVVRPCDSDDLANTMTYLLDNPQILEKFKTNIQEEWQKSMSWEGIAKDYINVYNEIVNKK